MESSLKSDIFSPRRPIFLYARTTCSELPSNISRLVCLESNSDLNCVCRLLEFFESELRSRLSITQADYLLTVLYPAKNVLPLSQYQNKQGIMIRYLKPPLLADELSSFKYFIQPRMVSVLWIRAPEPPIHSAGGLFTYSTLSSKEYPPLNKSMLIQTRFLIMYSKPHVLYFWHGS